MKFTKLVPTSLQIRKVSRISSRSSTFLKTPSSREKTVGSTRRAAKPLSSDDLASPPTVANLEAARVSATYTCRRPLSSLHRRQKQSRLRRRKPLLERLLSRHTTRWRSSLVAWNQVIRRATMTKVTAKMRRPKSTLEERYQFTKWMWLALILRSIMTSSQTTKSN